MKVGDRVVYNGNHYYPGLIYGKSYTISEVIDISEVFDDDYENDFILIFEKLPDVYGFLSDFITIKEYRKLKLQKLNGCKN